MSNKQYYIVLGGAILASAFGGAFQYFKKWKKDELNSWLEEYIKSVDEKLQKHKQGNQPLTVETICSIINLVAEIEEYLYVKDYSLLETNRISLFKNDNYENSVMNCISAHEKTFQRANKVIEKRLKVSINELQANLEELSGESISDKNAIKELLRYSKKNFPCENLPKVDKDTLKKAFLHYANQIEQLHKVDLNNLNIAKIKPEFKEIALHVYLVNKYILKDSLKLNYGIEEKYLNQLLTIHGLDQDSDVIIHREKILHL
jgi:hypothetical protein